MQKGCKEDSELQRPICVVSADCVKRLSGFTILCDAWFSYGVSPARSHLGLGVSRGAVLHLRALRQTTRNKETLHEVRLCKNIEGKLKERALKQTRLTTSFLPSYDLKECVKGIGGSPH